MYFCGTGEGIKIMKIIIAYVPVWCEGYNKFFEAHAGFEKLFILGRSITHRFRPFQKDLRSLDPYEMKSLLEWKRSFGEIEVLEENTLNPFEGVTSVVMPDEDISHEIAKTIPPNIEITFDTSHFLRWDAISSKKHLEVASAKVVSADSFLKRAGVQLAKEAERSPDLWRQIAGMIFDDSGVILMKHNECVPSPYHLSLFGDPRGQFKKGENVELSIFIHVEAGLIAEAARLGIPLEGKSMYVTTFPCPPCGKQVAFSGIKKLFFNEGYAMLDSEEVLIAKGVEIFQVKN